MEVPGESGFASDSETGQVDAGLMKKGQGSRCRRMRCSELGLLVAPDGPRIIMTGISVGFFRSGGAHVPDGQPYAFLPMMASRMGYFGAGACP